MGIAFLCSKLLLEGSCDPDTGGVHALGDRLAERVALLGLGLCGIIDLDNARAVQALAERDRYGKQKNSDSAVNKVARQHCKKRQEGVHADAVADDLRLDDLSDNAKHGPKDEKSDADADVADDEADDRPRNYDKTRADDGENVENGNQHSDQRDCRCCGNGEKRKADDGGDQAANKDLSHTDKIRKETADRLCSGDGQHEHALHRGSLRRGKPLILQVGNQYAKAAICEETG